jgi:RimJ/RimL family protein N-acetyltransferase
MIRRNGSRTEVRCPNVQFRLLADHERLTALYSNPNVTRHLGGPRDPSRAGEILNHRILAYYEEHPGLGIWMTVERATSARIGFHLLNHIQGESFFQVGFVLDQPAWGRGYATEMALPIRGDGGQPSTRA